MLSGARDATLGSNIRGRLVLEAPCGKGCNNRIHRDFRSGICSISTAPGRQSLGLRPLGLNVTEILSPALTRLAAYLTAHDPECGALDLVTAKRAYGKDTLIAAAWRIRIEPGSDERSVDVLAHPDHPFEPVAIGIADLAADERPLSGVFTNSTLCLESPDDPLPIASDDSMIVEVLARVRAQMG